MLFTHINDFLDCIAFEKRYSKHTIISYDTDLNQFSLFLKKKHKDILITELNYQHIRQWIEQLIKHKLGARSVNRKLSSLKSFFKFLMMQEIISQNPMAKITGPKTPKRLPVFIDENQMQNLFNDIVFDEGIIGKRDELILDLFYQTGIRRIELAHLTEMNTDLINGTIKVLGKRNKERIIPISFNLKRNLKEYLCVKKELNLINPILLVNDQGIELTENVIYNIVNKYLSLVTTIKKKSPHVLRHTFATHLLNNGADINAVKDLLGHASLRATQVYTHNTIEKLKTSYKQAHPRGDS